MALLDDHVITDEGDLFAIDEEKLRRSEFFVNKDGSLGSNAVKLLSNLAEARTRRCGGSLSRCPSGTSARPRRRR